MPTSISCTYSSVIARRLAWTFAKMATTPAPSLRPEPANAPPNNPHAQLTAHAPRISHAIARRGYRARGKAYVTSSAVRDQASLPGHWRPVGQSDYADILLAASPMGSLGIIERTQASCLRRSRHCASRSGFKVRTIRPAAERPGWSLDMGRQCTSAEMADDLPIACHSMYDTD